MSATIRWHRSLRTRIAAVFLLGVLAVVGLLGIALDRAIALGAVAELRSRTLDELAADTAVYDLTGVAPAGSTVGPVIAPATVQRSVRAGVVVSWWDGRTMWAAREVGESGQLVVRGSGASVATQRERLRVALLRDAVPLVLVLAALGWFAADRLTRRLRRAADQVGAGPPATPSGGDEVTELVQRLAEMTTALEESLDRERAFSSVVAHELRTPLTALSAAGELLPPGADTDLVRRQSVRLRRLVEDLLELARADHAEVELRSADLAELVRDAVADVPDVEVRVDGTPRARVDAEALRRVVANLVSNARRHGAAPVVVRVADRTVEVTDAGPGFPPELLRDGPRRFARHGSTGGTGLGLSIVQSWSRRFGATVELENLPDGAGARARLHLR